MEQRVINVQQQDKQETLMHAPKLWAEKNSNRALIIVSIKVTVYSLHNMYVDEFRGDPLFKTARKYINNRNG